MPPETVQYKIYDGINEVSHNLTFTSNVTAGNLICGLAIAWTSTVTVSSVVGSVNGSYTVVDNMEAGVYRGALFYKENISSGAETITVTFSGSAPSYLMAHEVSGLATASALDQHAVNVQPLNTTGTDNVTTGSVTTTTDGQYVVGFSSGEAEDPNISIGTGFTADYTGGVGSAKSEHLIQSSAGSVAATWSRTDTTSATHVSGIMTFKVPGGVPLTLMGAACL